MIRKGKHGFAYIIVIGSGEIHTLNFHLIIGLLVNHQALDKLLLTVHLIWVPLKRSESYGHDKI